LTPFQNIHTQLNGTSGLLTKFLCPHLYDAMKLLVTRWT